MRNQNWLVGASILLTLAACNKPDSDNNSTAAAQVKNPSVETEAPTPAPAPAAGPDVLSTVGLFDGSKAPVTEVKTAQALFALEQLNGVETLTVNGKPALYKPEGANEPMPVEANSGLTLVGVFELPQESVAWAIIGGGAACPADHILVGVRSGVVLPGQSIPGCDDRGTMRRNGDKITFEAGGSTGTYQNGLITVETNANDSAAGY